MKIGKRGLIISLAVVLAVACIAVIVVIAVGKKPEKQADEEDGYTVRFELCTDLNTTKVLERKVKPGSILEEPEVHVTGKNEENWSVSGWYTEAEYKTQWDFDFDTVEGDLTLYAKWETNPQYAVKFYTKEATDPVYIAKILKGLKASRCDEKFIGRKVLGYYQDKDMTQAFDFEEKIERDMDIYVELSDYIYFDAKTISTWNLCGNQTEVSNYEVATSLSKDESVYTVTSKNGGYLWLKNLELAMNGTSILEIKAREVNDNYSGNISGYVVGTYTVNGKMGVSADFGKPNTGSMLYGRSAKPDEDGFYTYTYNISNLTPGLIYNELSGIRIGFSGTSKYTYEIKELRSYVDEYAVSAEAFMTEGIDFSGLHLNAFSLIGNAETKMLANGDLRLGGLNGAGIYKKGLDIRLKNEQIIRLKAKGDLKGGAIALFFFGDYTLNGKAGTLNDYTAEHRVTFQPVSTDAEGYTIYTADISSIPGLKYNVIRGLRIDLYGEGSRTIDIQSLKSYKPTEEDVQVNSDFMSAGINFSGAHLARFLTRGEAVTERLANGDFRLEGPNGAFIYKKDMQITLDKDQVIQLKAKGELKNGSIALYFFGDYTLNGQAGTLKDYDGKHKVTFRPVSTDAEGYTIYTADISSIPGLKYNVIRGLRLDLYGTGTRTIEIQSLKSVEPEKPGHPDEPGEDELEKAFHAEGLHLNGEHFTRFNAVGNAEVELLENHDFRLSGPNGAFIHKKGLEITLGEDQIIRLKAKGDLKGGAIALYFFGDYTLNGQAGTLKDYDGKHKVTFTPVSTDAEGYTIYTADISSIPGLKYNVIRGLRLDLYGAGTRTIEIQSLTSVEPEKPDHPDEPGEDELEKAFHAEGLHLNGEHFTRFNAVGNAEVELLENHDFRLSGPNGAFIHKKGLEITLGEDQIIQLKAKGDLKGGAIALFFFGDYTLNGQAGTLKNYDGKHKVTFTPVSTDAEGYTIYTADISSIPGLKYNVIRGLRLDLYGTGTRMIDIRMLKSVEAASENNLYLRPDDLNKFTAVAGATKEITSTGSFLLKGKHGSFIHKKGLDYDIPTSQTIEMKAKASQNAQVVIYAFGDYTENGVSGSTTDYGQKGSWSPKGYWIMTKGETDADGYTTYTLDLSSENPAIAWNKLRGFRVELWGNGDLSLEIKEIGVRK